MQIEIMLMGNQQQRATTTLKHATAMTNIMGEVKQREYAKC